MKFLLDTHTFIWWDSDPQKLSEQVLNLLTDRNHQFMLSLVSLWEIQIKNQLGKLPLRMSLEDIVKQQQKVNRFELLPITFSHILLLEKIPIQPSHPDPFDRLLIAQAIGDKLPIITKDAKFAQYPIKIIW
jgi:PIN domain nuclease of toxin-antitoxin system